MAGGGFSSHAMQVVKANRALLNKRKRLTRADYIGVNTAIAVKSRKATPGQLRAVKLRMAAAKRGEMRIWVIAVVLSALVLMGVYFFFTG